MLTLFTPRSTSGPRAMPSWDAEREAALVDAVRRFGRHPQCWQAFARLPDLVMFTAQALRQSQQSLRVDVSTLM